MRDMRAIDTTTDPGTDPATVWDIGRAPGRQCTTGRCTRTRAGVLIDRCDACTHRVSMSQRHLTGTDSGHGGMLTRDRLTTVQWFTRPMVWGWPGRVAWFTTTDRRRGFYGDAESAVTGSRWDEPTTVASGPVHRHTDPGESPVGAAWAGATRFATVATGVPIHYTVTDRPGEVTAMAGHRVDGGPALWATDSLARLDMAPGWFATGPAMVMWPLTDGGGPVWPGWWRAPGVIRSAGAPATATATRGHRVPIRPGALAWTDARGADPADGESVSWHGVRAGGDRCPGTVECPGPVPGAVARWRRHPVGDPPTGHTDPESGRVVHYCADPVCRRARRRVAVLMAHGTTRCDHGGSVCQCSPDARTLATLTVARSATVEGRPDVIRHGRVRVKPDPATRVAGGLAPRPVPVGKGTTMGDAWADGPAYYIGADGERHRVRDRADGGAIVVRTLTGAVRTVLTAKGRPLATPARTARAVARVVADDADRAKRAAARAMVDGGAIG